MKKFILLTGLLLLFLSGRNILSAQRADSVTYEILKQNNRFFIEIPFGVGVASGAACFPNMYGDFRDANTYLGISGKYYLDNNIRLDLSYKASWVGTDDFEDMLYNPELILKGNYPLLSGSHRWGELIFLNSREYFLANTPKYRFLNVHGGYYRYHYENKLFLGLNYSTKSYIKVRLENSKRTKSSMDYFETGGEVLMRFANSEHVQSYYDFLMENTSKIGWNVYLLYTYSNLFAKLEIGGHNGPILKFTVGAIIPG